MADRQSSDSSRNSFAEAAASRSDTGSEIVLMHLSDKPAEEPLLPEDERSIDGALHRQRKPNRCAWISAVIFLALLCLSLIIAMVVRPLSYAKAVDKRRWDVKSLESIITFGDSYTDEMRADFFYKHNDTKAPAGTFFDGALRTSSRNWARYVIQYTGSSIAGQWKPQMTLYNYAFAGSWCTDEIIPRYPRKTSVLEGSIPAFIADTAENRGNTSKPFFQPELKPTNAVFVLWIGTNDLGMWAYLSNDQTSGKLLPDYTDCIYASFDGLYAAGARNFVLLNTVPLHLTPWYSNKTLSGAEREKDRWQADRAQSITASVNDIFRYKTPYEFTVSNRYPDAQVALFDVNSLMSNIYHNPELYLNGSNPINVTSYATESKANQKSPDSFMWRDNLHPSEQTHRIIAKEFVEVLNGNSTYAQYW